MENTIVSDLVNLLEDCHVGAAFGVSGGFVFPLWVALSRSKKINLFHCRHESGCAFSTSEYSLCNKKPAVAFATAGPGITSALTGIKAARLDGSHVIFISSITGDNYTGKYPTQETIRDEINQFRVHNGQGFFDEIYFISSLSDYIKIKKEIPKKIKRASGMVIGIFITPAAQNIVMTDNVPHDGDNKILKNNIINNTPLVSLDEITEAIMNNKVLFWVGFGARDASEEVRKIVALNQSRVISTPRGKGIFPENHPLCAGTTGIGSNKAAIKAELDPSRHPVVIILGTRLGELSSSYVQNLLVNSQVFYVGLNAHEVTQNLPLQTVLIDSDIGTLLRGVLSNIAQKRKVVEVNNIISAPAIQDNGDYPSRPRCLHPRTVMQVVQHIVIDKYDCYVAVDAGNFFIWAGRFLKFHQPARYRISTSFGSMSHYACGIIGISANTKNIAVGIIGDGSMLMSNEISTAVRYGLPAIWLVMNDSYYNMCRQGLDHLGQPPVDCEIPSTDFALFGQSMGAAGYTATNKDELELALISAITARRPAVIDVKIDQTVIPSLSHSASTQRELINE